MPKPMIDINGQPFLEHQIKLLKNYGFNRFLFLTGYLGDQIEQYFQNGERWGVEIIYSREPEPLGTGGALKLAESYLSEIFLLLYGDSYLEIDYLTFYKNFSNSEKLIQLVIYKDSKNETNVIPNVLWDEQTHKILSYKKDAGAPHTHVDSGVLMVRRQVLSLSKEKKFSFENEIFNQLISGQKLYGYESKNRFFDIGTFERLEIFRNLPDMKCKGFQN